MADPFGYCSFPGIVAIESATMTISHGITPSVCTMVVQPQLGTLNPIGTLVWTYGATIIPFRDCLVNEASFHYDQSGNVWSLSLYDRRWQWLDRVISGHYNRRFDDGTLDRRSLKTPQQLATLCLQAMGETIFNVAQLPDATFPEVHWDDSKAAQALADLCEGFGCRVVWNYLADQVTICQTGFGGVLPKGGAEVDNSSAGVARIPEGLILVGGQTRVQMDFVLEAIGKDVDGKIKLIHSLSYTPITGWDSEFPPDFKNVKTRPVNEKIWQALPAGNVLPGVDIQDPRSLARAYVWRYYRIKIASREDPNRLILPFFGEIKDRDRILPLDGKQVETIKDTTPAADPAIGAMPRWQSLPPLVYGVYFSLAPNGCATAGNTPEGTPYDFPFDVDTAKGWCIFDRYVYRFNPVGLAAAPRTFSRQDADLNLRIACSVRDKDTWAWHRYRQTLNLAGGLPGSGFRIIRHEELVLEIIPQYRPGGQVLKTYDNKTQLKAEADDALAAAAAEFQSPQPQEIVYSGLKRIPLDGAIQQVTFTTDGSGCTTRASRNDEHSTHVTSYRERRIAEQVRADQVRELKKAAAAAKAAKAFKPAHVPLAFVP